jgi:hypothetical protein
VQAAGGKHFCIDVRQFNSDGKVRAKCVFTMAKGYRGSVAGVEGAGLRMVQGHGWNGGYVVCILTDPDGKRKHTDDERDKQLMLTQRDKLIVRYTMLMALGSGDGRIAAAPTMTASTGQTEKIQVSLPTNQAREDEAMPKLIRSAGGLAWH